jgi:L-rhamnose mutarotase
LIGQNHLTPDMKRYCLALDLKENPALIAEYELWHLEVWEEVKKSIGGSGIRQMEIYRLGNRLFMIMETDETFSFEQKAKMDAANPEVQRWEQLMWKYQQALPWAKAGEKWMPMTKISDFHV